jgi:hypothetical protein
LVELMVLVGLAAIALGLFVVEGQLGNELLGTGLVIGSLAGLELSIREHLAGYRSHTLLLAGATAVAIMLGVYYLADLSAALSLIAGAVAGAICAWLLARAFRNRSGRLIKLR